MCYSAESSGGTFLFVAAIAALIAFGKGKPAIALVLLVLAFMQLVEAVIWTLTPACTPLNYVASSSIPLVLALQPTLIALILWRCNAGYASPPIYQFLFYLSSAVCAILLVHIVRTPRSSCVAPSATDPGAGHLNWGLDSTFFDVFQMAYYPLMAFLILSLKPWSLGVPLFAVYFLSWLYYQRRFPTEWPSLWCHGINAGAVLAAVVA
jgi:hypothetical protein